MSAAENAARMEAIEADPVAKAIYDAIEALPHATRLYPDLYALDAAAAARAAVADLLAGHLPERHVITEQVYACSCGQVFDMLDELTDEQAERAWAEHTAEVTA